MSAIEKIDRTQLPVHIAIIMDGNGRWAQKNNKDRFWGHQEGVVSVRKIVEAAVELKISYLTLYTFSTENWHRPTAEIEALMGLMVTAIQRETADLMKQNVRVCAIGDLSRLPQTTLDNLNACIMETNNNTGLTLILAMSYSFRWEMTQAVKNIANELLQGKLNIEEINESLVSQYLTTQHIPDPDLLIRTGGNYRMSNFLMWQLSYAELYFTELFWPEFRKEHFYQAIVDYQMRERRFGKTGEQVQSEYKSN